MRPVNTRVAGPAQPRATATAWRKRRSISPNRPARISERSIIPLPPTAATPGSTRYSARLPGPTPPSGTNFTPVWAKGPASARNIAAPRGHRLPDLLRRKHRSCPHEQLGPLTAQQPDRLQRGGSAQGHLHHGQSCRRQCIRLRQCVFGRIHHRHRHDAILCNSGDHRLRGRFSGSAWGLPSGSDSPSLRKKFPQRIVRISVGE